MRKVASPSKLIVISQMNVTPEEIEEMERKLGMSLEDLERTYVDSASKKDHLPYSPIYKSPPRMC